MWRLAGGLSSRRAKFLQLVPRAMVELDLEAVQKITWRFEGYASARRRAMCSRYGVDTTQGGACPWQQLRWVEIFNRCARRLLSSKGCKTAAYVTCGIWQ
jgi:hypothetical protein